MKIAALTQVGSKTDIARVHPTTTRTKVEAMISNPGVSALA